MKGIVNILSHIHMPQCRAQDIPEIRNHSHQTFQIPEATDHVVRCFMWGCVCLISSHHSKCNNASSYLSAVTLLKTQQSSVPSCLQWPEAVYPKPNSFNVCSVLLLSLELLMNLFKLNKGKDELQGGNFTVKVKWTLELFSPRCRPQDCRVHQPLFRQRRPWGTQVTVMLPR